jgi:hypothetical protein
LFKSVLNQRESTLKLLINWDGLKIKLDCIYNKISISKFYRVMEILNGKKHGRAVPSFLKKTY